MGTIPLNMHILRSKNDNISAPSVPREMKILKVTDTSIQISWWEPARQNGILQVLDIQLTERNTPGTRYN